MCQIHDWCIESSINMSINPLCLTFSKSHSYCGCEIHQLIDGEHPIIPLFIGLQHVSTIFVVQDFATTDIHSILLRGIAAICSHGPARGFQHPRQWLLHPRHQRPQQRPGAHAAELQRDGQVCGSRCQCLGNFTPL